MSCCDTRNKELLVLMQGALAMASASTAAMDVSLKKSTAKKRLLLETLIEDEKDAKKASGNSNFMKDWPKVRLEPLLDLHTSEWFSNAIRDPGRGYVEAFTALKGWELYALAEHLKSSIERPRRGAKTDRISPCKVETTERLFACLSWLHSGTTFRQSECHLGWSRQSIYDDLRHVLEAIVEGLDDELQWPSAGERARIHESFYGVFKGCVGIIDVTEHSINKPSLPGRERQTYSGKHRHNSLKTFAVIDPSGMFRYVVTDVPGKISDRELYTRSALYLNSGQYFSEGEWVAADGGFRGDGAIGYGFDGRDLNTEERRMYNLAFKELRQQVENAFCRLKMWFGCLGKHKSQWDCSEDMFILVVQATVRLHNWMLRIRTLNYSPLTNPAYLFQTAY